MCKLVTAKNTVFALRLQDTGSPSIEAGSQDPDVGIVDRDPDAPQFQTLLAIATKAQ
ncbi:MAG TPA: hypothetical protein VG225_16100 [Terracidiphilus sp.]|jgi:hypothetical protein|nr:hypothetical protein [Terracidiphilus sp.]